MAGSDNERTNQVGLFNTARSYWRSAEHLSAAHLDLTHPQAPITFLLCHAIELYLKAYLRGTGSDVRQLKQLGHNVASLARSAIKSGLVIGPEHSEILDHVDDADVAIEARYIKTGFKQQPTNEALSNVAAMLDQTICSALAKKGVPLRAEAFTPAVLRRRDDFRDDTIRETMGRPDDGPNWPIHELFSYLDPDVLDGDRWQKTGDTIRDALSLGTTDLGANS